MGRAPWLEEFASRWAARWVESQLPSWLGAALRQTFIGFQLRFVLHQASVDDTSMTCCSCTPREAMFVQGSHTENCGKMHDRHNQSRTNTSDPQWDWCGA
jgi:hypothetical protein